MILEELVTLAKVKRSELVGDAKAIIQTFFERPARNPQDTWDDGENADESDPADSWQHYGFVSRLPAGAEALLVRFGLSVFTVASRFLETATTAGKLGEGDVAIYSMGGNVIRLNANGSISMLVKTESGKHLVMRADPKGNGSIKGMNGAGMAFEFSEENGIVLNAGDKDVTIAGKQIQFNGVSLVNNCPSFKSTATATMPLTTGPITKANPGLFI